MIEKKTKKKGIFEADLFQKNYIFVEPRDQHKTIWNFVFIFIILKWNVQLSSFGGISLIQNIKAAFKQLSSSVSSRIEGGVRGKPYLIWVPALVESALPSNLLLTVATSLRGCSDVIMLFLLIFIAFGSWWEENDDVSIFLSSLRNFNLKRNVLFENSNLY